MTNEELLRQTIREFRDNEVIDELETILAESEKLSENGFVSVSELIKERIKELKGE